MTYEEHRILVRWAGMHNLVWDDSYPLSHGERAGLEVCDKCGIGVDFLILQSDVSEEEIQRSLDELREWMADSSFCGRHRLPKTEQLQPQSEDR